MMLKKKIQLCDDLDLWRDTWTSSVTYNLLADDEKARDENNFEILKRLVLVSNL